MIRSEYMEIDAEYFENIANKIKNNAPLTKEEGIPLIHISISQIDRILELMGATTDELKKALIAEIANRAEVSVCVKYVFLKEPTNNSNKDRD